jgi:hypothetical protein
MFKKEIENRLTISKKNIVAEIPSFNEENLKWVSIYPIDLNEYKFRVLILELPKNLIENDLDWFEDDEIEEEYFFENYDNLMIFLYERDLKPEIFDYPWNKNYPYPE